MPVKAGMAWKHRRMGPVKLNPSQWANPTKADLKPVVQRWQPMLAEVDGFWPHRRVGKKAFWQDRYLKPKPAPAARPGPRPMQRPRRPRPMGRYWIVSAFSYARRCGSF